MVFKIFIRIWVLYIAVLTHDKSSFELWSIIKNSVINDIYIFISRQLFDKI